MDSPSIDSTATDSSAPSPVITPHLAWSASAAGLSGICFCGLAAFVLIGWEPALWLQPSVVGIFWSGLFLAGFACGSFGRGSLSSAVGAVGVAVAANTAFCQITDLGSADTMLVSCLLMSAGCLTAKAGSSGWTAFPNQNAAANEGWSRFSIWDIAFATCMVAQACSALPRLESHPALLISVLVAVVGGLLCSWTACRWVFHDVWPIGRVACLGLIAAAAIGLILAKSPMSVPHTTSWLLVGPLNVIASQTTCVLFFCGLLRWDRFRAE